MRWPTQPPKRNEWLSFIDASSFDATQIRWPWEGILMCLCLTILMVHYLFAVAAYYFSTPRGKLRQRL